MRGRYLWLALSALAALAQAAPPGPRLVKDINRTSWHPQASPEVTVALNGRVYYPGCDLVHGLEIWASDGTPEGTRLLKDINPGQAGSNPAHLVVMGGKIYFTVDLPSQDTQLWVSDGTPAGTRLMPEPALDLETPQSWSQASDGSIWTVDGVPAEALLQQIGGFTGAGPSHLTLMGETLFFEAHTNEVWKSDGTGAGTLKVADLSEDPQHWISSLQIAGERWVALLQHPATDASLWSGDAAGNPQPVTLPIAPAGGVLPYIPDLALAGGHVCYFAYDKNAPVPKLWALDATTLISTLLGSFDFEWPQHVNVGSSLFFTGAKNNSGYELWKTDGTAAGTMLVKDIRPGPMGAAPSFYAPSDQGLYFTANDGVHGQEPWFSDGTAAGTRLLADVRRGAGSYFIFNLCPVAGKLFFSNHEIGQYGQLWVTDGTPRGTRSPAPLVKRANRSALWEGDSHGVGASGRRAFFLADDGKTGNELWVSTGSRGGTRLVRDFLPGTGQGSFSSMTALGKGIVFDFDDGEGNGGLWFSDGSKNGTRLLASDVWADDMTRHGEICYFTAYQNGHFLLWQTDGTVAGTLPVPALTGLYVNGQADGSRLALVDGGLYFSGLDADGNTGLWYLKNGNAWKAAGINPNHLTAIGGRLDFFSVGYLWTSDWHTGGGTQKVLQADLEVHQTLAYGDLHFFLAEDDLYGTGWWRSDGTPTGTVFLKELTLDPDGPGIHTGPGYAAVADQGLFFVADDGEHGFELWRSNGTREGTALVKDLVAGSGSSSPAELVTVDGRLYFVATDDAHGRDLWTSDGSAAGTLRIPLPKNGNMDSCPHMLIPSEGRLFFAASSPLTGSELHLLDLPKP